MDKFGIIIIGYSCYLDRLKHALDAIVATNTQKWKIYVGLNSPTPDMAQTAYASGVDQVIISRQNLNKVGMQRRLVQLCESEYIVSFDDDALVVAPGWQELLVDRVQKYENKELEPSDWANTATDPERQRLTNNRVGMFGLLFRWPFRAMRERLEKASWYEPASKIRVEARHPQDIKPEEEFVTFCAGAFYVFLREPYLAFHYPGFDFKMSHEDTILSYFFQHHGYRLGDLRFGFPNVPLVSTEPFFALGNRIDLNGKERSHNVLTVEQEGPVDLSALRMVSFEIGTKCNLSKLHKTCPASIRQDTDEIPLSDDDFIRFVMYLKSECKFSGDIAFHYYNEPMIFKDRMLRLMDRLPRFTFVLWTNGLFVPDNAEFVGRFRSVYISDYGIKDLSALAKYPNVSVCPAFLDNRMRVYDLPPINSGACSRLFIEMPIDYYGNVHLCCIDYKNEVKIGNVKAGNFADIAKKWGELQLSMKEQTFGVCLRCPSGLRA